MPTCEPGADRGYSRCAGKLCEPPDVAWGPPRARSKDQGPEELI